MFEHAQGRAWGGVVGCRAGTGQVVVSQQDPSWKHKSQLLPWEVAPGGQGQSRPSPGITMLSTVLEDKDAGCSPCSALLVPVGNVCPSPCGRGALALLGASGPFPHGGK